MPQLADNVLRLALSDECYHWLMGDDEGGRAIARRVFSPHDGGGAAAEAAAAAAAVRRLSEPSSQRVADSEMDGCRLAHMPSREDFQNALVVDTTTSELFNPTAMAAFLYQGSRGPFVYGAFFTSMTALPLQESALWPAFRFVGFRAAQGYGFLAVGRTHDGQPIFMLKRNINGHPQVDEFLGLAASPNGATFETLVKVVYEADAPPFDEVAKTVDLSWEEWGNGIRAFSPGATSMTLDIRAGRGTFSHVVNTSCKAYWGHEYANYQKLQQLCFHRTSKVAFARRSCLLEDSPALKEQAGNERTGADAVQGLPLHAGGVWSTSTQDVDVFAMFQQSLQDGFDHDMLQVPPKNGVAAASKSAHARRDGASGKDRRWGPFEAANSYDTSAVHSSDNSNSRLMADLNTVRPGHWSPATSGADEGASCLESASRAERYMCAQCAKVFAGNKELRRHTRTIHEKERRFNCKICALTFSQSGHLSSHVRTIHEQRKDFECTCHRKFALRSNLNKHQKRMQGRCTSLAAGSAQSSPPLSPSLPPFR
ncbi:MDS1 and EVI1 complex locus protein EVI1 [Porphyridium purpureum]|uniref:MDS1 and EVI1 complex locus protein EVI1 n=1 Tax=Porphyridium purpureum TaxID=35688 RepID=A0A5J4Z4Q2_PORPP|nr:MDS1 and EVI1 complex locus protein EVI1 [Porphyridium purpureum]|eukprot:POR3678..scf295_1